jgi:large subunit ribosomal protein L10Ae
MSKLSSDVLQSAIKEILEYSLTTKKRGFVETVELQVGLKNYDPTRDKKFSGSVVLPHRVKTSLTVIVIGDQQHFDEATAANITVIDSTGLQAFKKDKKKIKKWGKLLFFSLLIL